MTFKATLQPLWSHYGGKYRLATKYPAPKHQRIVEPFAGAAGYSLRHYLHDVVLVERDPRIAGVWRYLLRVCATWFVDPPYNNAAGNGYKFGAKLLDFARLAEWCRALPGQVMVCENAGATWLPFRPLLRQHGQIHSTVEAIWQNEWAA